MRWGEAIWKMTHGLTSARTVETFLQGTKTTFYVARSFDSIAFHIDIEYCDVGSLAGLKHLSDDVET